MKPKIRYFAETDTLDIEVAREPAAEAEEVAEDLILDYDAARRVVGITIEHASVLLATVPLRTPRPSAR